ncbi:ATP-binding protein [Embleya sp. NPDC059259]|uniref:ATP-binding protein n=1 Tax=unclassified Embleya TaxID=2699296 RepID=UPI0036B0D8D1
MFAVAHDKVATGPGFYMVPRSRGFLVHMTASPRHLRLVRGLAESMLSEAGVDAATTAAVQLVLSELIGNAVRVCGDFVPLVVEMDPGRSGVTVKVHDPCGERLPRRKPVALDDDRAEDGRGLGLVDLLAPGWYTLRTPVGKQIRCRVAHEGAGRG